MLISTLTVGSKNWSETFITKQFTHCMDWFFLIVFSAQFFQITLFWNKKTKKNGKIFTTTKRKNYTELTSRKRKRARTCPLTWPILTLISYCTSDIYMVDTWCVMIVCLLKFSINPFTAKWSQRKFCKFHFVKFWKTNSSESAGRELSFEWSHRRISSTDSKVRVTLQNSIKHSGSERVKI